MRKKEFKIHVTVSQNLNGGECMGDLRYYFIFYGVKVCTEYRWLKIGSSVGLLYA